MTIIHSMYGLPESTALNKADRFIAGMECEIEAVASRVNIPGFSFEDDHSLRNNGVEYISKPLTKEPLLKAFKNLHATLTFTNKNEAFSVRTSTHVHVNCRPLDEEAVRTLVLLYALFEECFFAHVSPNRRSNIHCVPLTETILPNYYGHNLNSLVGQWSKYTAINLLPLAELGTVEFRHLQGTDNPELVESWLTSLENLWLLAQRTKVDATTLSSKEQIYTWFRCIFSHAPAIMALESSLFNIIENSLLDVKLSTVKE